MTKDNTGSASGPSPKAVPTRQAPQDEDEVEEASEESFPASDSPAWNTGHETEPVPSTAAKAPVESDASTADASKEGCAVSFIMEQRGELDKLCERTPSEQSESYTEPDNVKDAGGED